MHSNLKGHPSLLQAVRKLETLGTDQFELYFQRVISTKIDSKEQKVESLTRSEDVGLAIRVLKDKRLGFSFTTSLEKSAIDRAVNAASDIARYMPEDDFAGLFSFSSTVYPEIDTLDQKGLDIPIEQKIAMAREIEASARRADKRVTTVRSATLSETFYEIHMIDSNGEAIEHRSTIFSGSISCKAEENGDSQMGGEYDFSNYLDNLNVTEIGKRGAAYATEILGASQAPTMRCPAVIRNDVVGDLLGFLAGSFSAEEIFKGRSMLAGKKGERLFSEKVSIVDDGLLPGGYSTAPFDSEGHPSQTTTLVDGGFLTGALYDGYYARKLGAEPTGNASRSLKSPPSIGITNLYMEKGKKSFNSLLDGIQKGILITNLMGIHTANPVTGDFSLGASGILIENGKLSRPVRGFAVAGNVLELFRRMTDISSDLKFSGNVGAPSVRVSELSVGGQ